MDIIFRTLVHLIVTTKVIAFNFDGFMKNLPIPADLKAVILDMNQKQQEISVPGTDGITSTDFRTGTPFIAKKPNEMIKPTRTLINKPVTRMNKPVTTMNKPVTRMNKPVTKINKPVTKINKSVTQRNKLLRSLGTLKPRPCVLKTTAKSPDKPTTSQPPFMPMPIPMPVPIGMHIYARAPIVLPMRTYFEKVEHDHPPLYKIKKIIEEDNKKWKEENIKSDSDISVVIEDSDVSTDLSDESDMYMDTDSSSLSEYDMGPDYYDGLININVRGRDR